MPILQIRNVPDELHRNLKARAALAGMSLSEYALAELSRAVERPTRAELLERLDSRSLTALTPSPAKILRKERKRR